MKKYLWSLLAVLWLSSYPTQAHEYQEVRLSLSPKQQLVLIDVALKLVEEDGLEPEPDPGAELPTEGLSGLIEDTFTSYDAAIITQIGDAVAQSPLQEAFEPLYYLGFSEHLSMLAYHFDQSDDEDTHTHLDTDTQQALEKLEQVLQTAKSGGAE